jgi:hypothetical protein
LKEVLGKDRPTHTPGKFELLCGYDQFSSATIGLSGNDLICFLQGLPRRTRLLLTTPFNSLYFHCYNSHCVHDSKPDQSPENDVRRPFRGHAQ